MFLGITYGMAQEVTLHFEKTKLSTVLSKIEKDTGYTFSYSNQVVDVGQRVSIDLDASELSVVLYELFSPLDIKYSIEKGKKILLKKGLSAKTASRGKDIQILQGTVVDNMGAVIGASVLVKGTSNGTTTDIDGDFVLSDVPADATIQISYIGYKTLELPANGDFSHVMLQEDSQVLEEVVVIGYGTQSKTKVTGAVAKIDAAQLNKVASASLDQQLSGKMSGVIVNQTNGQPGAASSIIIRGIGTLTAGTNPLIVVDGYPLTEGSSLNSINPNDIKDISVLKDAASSAIYGSRAANGVIMVTTKRGSKNEKTKIQLNTYIGIQKEDSGVELVDAYDFAQFITEARNWGYVSKDPTNRKITDPNSVRVKKKLKGKNIDGRELFLDFLQPYLDKQPGLTNTDWKNEAFKIAPMYNYDISASGGTDKTNYYLSLGYFNQEGVVIGTDMKRYSAAIKINSEINEKIKFGVTFNPSYTTQNAKNQASRSSGALALIPLNLPYYSAYNEDGSINISDQIINEQRKLEGTRINGTPVENLLATSFLVKDQNNRFRTFGNLFLTAELINNLEYKLLLGGDYDSYVKEHYYPSNVGSYRKPAPRNDADGNQRKLNRYNFLIENTLNYKLNLDKHSFNFLAGYTFQKEFINSTYVKGTGYADDNIQNISGASVYSADYNSSVWTLESYLARVQYDYDAKYLLSAAIRTDGSSRFGQNNRWGYFPSLSVGWAFTREDFFPDTDIINSGKISVSWGQTGNNQIGNYGSYALVTASNYVWGDALAPGFITSSSPNPNLGWEIASSLNIGIDLSLLNKFNMTLAYYKTNTRDLLLNLPVPQQTGYSKVLANIGEMENKGFEFEVSGNNMNIGGDFKFGFNANLTTYKNTVISLGSQQDVIATGRDENFVTKVGHSIAEIYGYDIIGIYKTQEEINKTPHLSGTITGDYIVRDVDNNGKIDSNDKISKGSYIPNFTYGFGANIDYKGFNFSFDFTGITGRTLLDGDMASLTEAGEGFSVPSKYYFNNRYHPVNNPNGFLGQPNFGNFSNARKQVRSSSIVEKNNGDYFRLRNVRLSYTFSERALKKVKLSGLQLYLSANNLFTLTKYRGWNPDGTSSNILTSGYNTGGNYPIAKTFILGARIEF